MSIGAISDKKNLSFEDWLKLEHKDGQVKGPPQNLMGRNMTPNGVNTALAQKLHSGETIFQVASQNPTKETAGASGASSNASVPQPSTSVDNIWTVGADNNTQAIGAPVQTQAPALASGLKAPDGGENAGSQDDVGSQSDQLNRDLYSQYEAAIREAQIDDSAGTVSTGEGTLSTTATGGTDSSDGISNPSGVDSTSGTDPTSTASGPPSTSDTPTGSVGSTDSAGGASQNGDDSSQGDSSKSDSHSINKQEQKHQEEILDSRRFHKLTEEQAA